MSIEANGSSEINQTKQSVQHILECLPKDNRGRIRWVEINEDPEEFQSILKDIARAFITEGNPLTQKSLRVRGLGTMVKAANRFFPNSLGGLRQSIGLSPAGMRENSSQSITDESIPKDNRGRIRWSILEQDPVRLMIFIESEVAKFVTSGQRLTHKNLVDAGMGVLARGIQRYYPGDLTALEVKFNAVSSVTPRGFWQSPNVAERIREEARLVLDQEGKLSRQVFIQVGKGYLIRGISQHYPGRWTGLRNDLNANFLRKPNGFWSNPVNIENEAREFSQQAGRLDRKALLQGGRQDLLGAINRYPGGIAALRIKLGLEAGKKNQYWTVERIEAEAEQVYIQIGKLSQLILYRHGRSDLIHAAKRYPGGFTALKEKLIKSHEAPETTISSDEANEELRKLVENS